MTPIDDRMRAPSTTSEATSKTSTAGADDQQFQQVIQSIFAGTCSPQQLKQVKQAVRYAVAKEFLSQFSDDDTPSPTSKEYNLFVKARRICNEPLPSDKIAAEKVASSHHSISSPTPQTRPNSAPVVPASAAAAGLSAPPTQAQPAPPSRPTDDADIALGDSDFGEPAAEEHEEVE